MGFPGKCAMAIVGSVSYFGGQAAEVEKAASASERARKLMRIFIR
jgi:hypothetical protein